MKTVNPYFLHTLLEPLTGLADDDDAMEEYSGFDSNNEQSVRQVIRELIVPHAKSLSSRCLERVRIAYRYYLSKPSPNFERVFESVLPPFDPPNDPRDFFVLIWEECFPSEDFTLEDIEAYVENADINEPLSVKANAD